MQQELDGELPALHRGRLRDHLLHCSGCQEIHHQFATLQAGLRELAELSGGASPMQVGGPAISGKPAIVKRAGGLALPRSRRLVRPAGLAAAAAVALLFGGWWLLGHDEPVTEPQRQLVREHGALESERVWNQRPAGVPDTGETPVPHLSITGETPVPHLSITGETPVPNRSLVRVEFDPASDVIAVPIETKNPNVTIIWLYPTVKMASSPEPAAVPPSS